MSNDTLVLPARFGRASEYGSEAAAEASDAIRQAAERLLEAARALEAEQDFKLNPGPAVAAARLAARVEGAPPPALQNPDECPF